MDDAIRPLVERVLTYRRYPTTEILAAAVVAAAVIASVWEVFGSVVGFMVRLGLLSDFPPLEGWWAGDPAPIWRFPVAAVTGNAAVTALWWYYARAERRPAAVAAVTGGLGLWVLLGVPGVWYTLALLIVAGWWVLPDEIERAGGYTVGCTLEAHSCGHPHHRRAWGSP